MTEDPTFLSKWVEREESTGDGPEVLSGVIEIDDLDRTGEVLLSQVPDPFGTIADDDLGLCPIPTAFESLDIEALAEVLGRFDGTDVGSGIIIPDREAFVIARGLREHTPQFDLAGSGWLARVFSFPSGGFLLRDGHTGAIHQDIKLGNRLTENVGKFQLNRTLNLLLIAVGDVFANRFRYALNGLYRDIDPRENPHLFLSTLKRGVLPHQGQHTADARREIRFADVQVGVDGAVSFMAERTQVAGPGYGHWPECRNEGLGAQLPITGQVTAGA